MFHTGRRWVLFATTSTLPVASIALALYIKSKTANNYLIAAFFAVVLLLAITTAWYSHIQPLHELSSAVTMLLDALGSQVVELGQADSIDPRINLGRILLISQQVEAMKMQNYTLVEKGFYRSNHSEPQQPVDESRLREIVRSITHSSCERGSGETRIERPAHEHATK